MGTATTRLKTRISIVDTLPSLGKAELGELFYLRGDDKIYIRLVEGWKATAALA